MNDFPPFQVRSAHHRGEGHNDFPPFTERNIRIPLLQGEGGVGVGRL